MTLLSFKNNELEEGTQKTCKGLFFRARVGIYTQPSNGAIVHKESMVPLIRKSCTGCTYCDWLLEDLKERISNDNTEIFEDIEDGKMYQLKATNFCKDWETGFVDDWDLTFVEVENDQKKP